MHLHLNFSSSNVTRIQLNALAQLARKAAEVNKTSRDADEKNTETRTCSSWCRKPSMGVGPQVPRARPGSKGTALAAAGLSVWSQWGRRAPRVCCTMLFHALSKFHLKQKNFIFNFCKLKILPLCRFLGKALSSTDHRTHYNSSIYGFGHLFAFYKEYALHTPLL